MFNKRLANVINFGNKARVVWFDRSILMFQNNDY